MERKDTRRTLRDSGLEPEEVEAGAPSTEDSTGTSAHLPRTEAEELAELGDEIVRRSAYLQETEDQLQKLMAEYDRLQGSDGAR